MVGPRAGDRGGDVEMAKWPPKIQEAEDRMKKGLADVEADKESGKAYDVKRRNKLMER